MLTRTMLKGKIHRARVTDADLNYEGSITIDGTLMEEADILPYEKVAVVNVNNGARLETYAIAGKPGSGVICLNGAAARLAAKDDLVIIMSYCEMAYEDAKRASPLVVFVDEHNSIVRHEVSAAAP